MSPQPPVNPALDLHLMLAQLHHALDRSHFALVDEMAARLDATPIDEATFGARARAAISHAMYRRSRLDDAARQAARALELGRASGDTLAQAEGLVAWARVDWASGELEAALAGLEEAALLGAADPRLRLHLNNLLGLVLADLRQSERSLAFHRLALAAARELGVPDLLMVALTNVAGRLLELAEQAADTAAAQPVWDELDGVVAAAERVATSNQIELTLPHVLVTQGASLVQRGRIDEALAVFDRQRRLMDQHADRSSLLHATRVLAQVHRRRGDLAAARAALQEGIAEAARRGARAREAELQLAACELEEQAGRFREALAHHKRFHALREASAVEAAQRKAAALAVRIETERALRDAAAQRQRAQELAASNDRLRVEADALSRAATIDPLTGLGNRRLLDEQLARLHAACRESGSPLVLALLDVDHFKRINDGHSHAVGDRVLVALGRLIASHCRTGDLCARFGGEEFVVALPGVDEAAGVAACERLRELVAAHDWAALAPGLSVTVSIGVAEVAGCSDPAAALAHADARLYAAKAQGRDRVVGSAATPC